MVELDGVEYQVQDTETVASEIVERINSYCKEHGVTNSQGDIVFIDANRANPLYMIIWGLSYVISILQRLIYNVGCAFNIAASSPRQLLNLADIAGVKRNDATYTIIPCLIYAADTGDCIITKDLLVKTVAKGTELKFHPAFEATVTAGHVLNVPLICEITGPFTIEEGWADKFEAPVDNLDHIILAASIPGADQETIASLRARMQQRKLNFTQVDAARDASRILPGVASCSIFFNYSNVDDVVVGDITISPRKALVVVQGYSDDIAEAYYSHLLCESVPGPEDRTQKQDYITHANQHMPVYFVSPRPLPVYIHIVVDAELTDEMVQKVKDKACEISLHLSIGDSLSTFQVMELVTATPGITAKVLGCSLGDAAATGQFQVTPEADQLLTLAPEHITIEVLS